MGACCNSWTVYNVDFDTIDSSIVKIWCWGIVKLCVYSSAWVDEMLLAIYIVVVIYDFSAQHVGLPMMYFLLLECMWLTSLDFTCAPPNEQEKAMSMAIWRGLFMLPNLTFYYTPFPNSEHTSPILMRLPNTSSCASNFCRAPALAFSTQPEAVNHGESIGTFGARLTTLVDSMVPPAGKSDKGKGRALDSDSAVDDAFSDQEER